VTFFLVSEITQLLGLREQWERSDQLLKLKFAKAHTRLVCVVIPTVNGVMNRVASPVQHNKCTLLLVPLSFCLNKDNDERGIVD
jgi:hypothetical protein